MSFSEITKQNKTKPWVRLSLEGTSMNWVVAMPFEVPPPPVTCEQMHVWWAGNSEERQGETHQRSVPLVAAAVGPRCHL